MTEQREVSASAKPRPKPWTIRRGFLICLLSVFLIAFGAVGLRVAWSVTTQEPLACCGIPRDLGNRILPGLSVVIPSTPPTKQEALVTGKTPYPIAFTFVEYLSDSDYNRLCTGFTHSNIPVGRLLGGVVITHVRYCPVNDSGTIIKRVDIYRSKANANLFDRMSLGFNAPDEKLSSGPCLAYADSPYAPLFVSTPRGYFQLKFPSDGCGHHGGAAKATWELLKSAGIK